MAALAGYHHLARLWFHGMLGASLWILGVVCLAFGASWCVRRWSPWWTSWCWRLAYLKLLVMALGVPSLGLPVLPGGPASSSMSKLRRSRPPGVRGKVEPKARLKAPGRRVSKQRAAAMGARLSEHFLGTRRPAVEPGWHPISWLFTLWWCGVLWLLLGLFLQARRLRAGFGGARVFEDQAGIYAGLCQQMGLGRAPLVEVVEEARSPLLVGLWSPRILLPEAVVKQCKEAELRLILAHELAHFRRRDLHWQWLMGLLHSAFFFHPALYFARRAWLLSQEMAADEEALRWTRDDAAQYGRLLLDLAQLQGSGSRVFATFGAFRSFNMLRRRIRAMGYYDGMAGDRTRTWLFGVGLLAAMAIVPWHLEAARAPRPKLQKKLLPGGWFLVGYRHSAFSFGIDRKTYYDGKASAYVRLKDPNKRSRFIGLRQLFRAQPYRGKRIRVTAYLKTSHAKSHPFMTLRVHDEKRRLSFGNSELSVLPRRPAVRHLGSSTRWRKHEIVLDVPSQATYFALSCFASLYRGSLWCDAFRIQEVQKQVPITNGWFAAYQKQSGLVPNLGFERSTQAQRDGLSAWTLVGPRARFGLDAAQKHSGSCSAYLQPGSSSGRPSLLLHRLSAKKYRGKRLQIQGYLKGSAGSKASLWASVRGRRRKLFSKSRTPGFQGPHGWKLATLTVDVPHQARFLRLGCLARGSGKIWCDSFQLKVLGALPGSAPPARRRPPLATAPQNTDFRAGTKQTRFGVFPKHWQRWGSMPRAYQVGVSRKVVRTQGGASGFLKRAFGSRGFGQLLQFISAQKYKGKRIRLTAYLKAKDSQNIALVLAAKAGRRTLGFQRKTPSPFKPGWLKLQIVQDVPAHATRLFFGCRLRGAGNLWCADFKLEVVGAKTPVTAKRSSWDTWRKKHTKKKLSNPSFDRRP